MKLFNKSLFALIVVILLTASDAGLNRTAFSSSETARASSRRIRFQIAAVEERGETRDVISEAIVEGPPGTDFTVNLQAGRFKMDARFLTDLVSNNRLKVRARLNTRRLYGRSERDLPLYEEDAQYQALDLGFDEGIVLLPFGRTGGDRLKIEITPGLSDQPVYLATGQAAPLAINIVKQSPGGAISIKASKIPHSFEVEAALLEDSREVARGSAVFLIEEAREMILAPAPSQGSELAASLMAIKLSIDEYTRTRPADLVAISFDLSLLDPQGSQSRKAIASRWAGVATLGGEMVYDISDYYLKESGRKYGLRIRIKPAAGEILQ